MPGVASRLKCRGQVIATTRRSTYEVSLKELGFRPEPYAIADALMYADGKPIVEITDMSLRAERHDARAAGRDLVGRAAGPPPNDDAAVVFTREQILAFAIGNPSKAFGDRYRPFDRDRFIARLPGAAVLVPRPRRPRSRTASRGSWPPAATVEAEYDVPPDAWYFAADRCDRMPFSVLLEVALQPCGWLAAYLGSALTSPDDLYFRNLGGNAIQHAAVGPDAGTLTTTVKLTKVSPSAGMIIQHYDFDVPRRGRPVYRGDTTSASSRRRRWPTRSGCKDAPIARTGRARRTGRPGPDRPAVPRRDAADDRHDHAGTSRRRAEGTGLRRRPSAGEPGRVVLQGPLLPGPGLAGVAGAGIVRAAAEGLRPSTLGRSARPAGRRWLPASRTAGPTAARSFRRLPK